MLTITELAKQCDISRTTVLYYERAGLLKPASRAANGYRTYGQKELERLKNIVSYRSYGVPVGEIAPLLESDNEHKQEQILRNQFNALENEVQRLRQQQKAILTLLNQSSLSAADILTKERWTELMAASGLSEQDMTNWHKQFESMEPEAHQRFLESLGIDKDEIEQLRQSFREIR
ncbi:MerR family transcriptional regulator [Vibrio sp. SCSIO 43137]|uniref:MerR family transcriptional regulator n=1 Tax=Vibrio sp. SCSIO 43137 TaxID=3021011 RepID=UPI00230751C1|nr:MerR family transcriptional regulator [Vibrio sp. SCSIO 43137]WCE31519.1 MerR family transcriptional regulator [Vibrio sp. SCSIO 43137]